MLFKKLVSSDFEDYGSRFDKVDSLASWDCHKYCPDIIYADTAGGCCHDHDFAFFRDIQP
jgi:hypothetical protein